MAGRRVAMTSMAATLWPCLGEAPGGMCSAASRSEGKSSGSRRTTAGAHGGRARCGGQETGGRVLVSRGIEALLGSRRGRPPQYGAFCFSLRCAAHLLRQAARAQRPGNKHPRGATNPPTRICCRRRAYEAGATLLQMPGPRNSSAR